MKWALIVVLMSGVWDSGMRFDSYGDCRDKGIEASFDETVAHLTNIGKDKKHKGLTEITIAKIVAEEREIYKAITKCVPAK